jgi:hypothetical protein
MLAAIFSELKGVLGRTYLLAGLIPSAVFLLCWRWLKSGAIDPSPILLSYLTQKAKDTLPQDTLVFIFYVLVFGLFFYAARSVFLHFLQELPWLRRWGYYWQRFKLSRAQREKNDRDWQASALMWLLKGAKENFKVSRFYQKPALEQARRGSLAARGIIERELKGVKSKSLTLGCGKRKKVIRGLKYLYAWVGHESSLDDNFCLELKKWRELAKQDQVKDFLNEQLTIGRRNRNRARDRLAKRYPQKLWLKPSALGNSLEVLNGYCHKRYNIPTSTLWLRLRHLLKPEELKEVANAQLAVEVLVNLTMVFAFLALYAVMGLFIGLLKLVPGYLYLVNLDPFASLFLSIRSWFCTPVTIWRCLVFAFGFFVLCRLSYHGAIFAFGRFSNNMIGLIDLHRTKVLTAMGFKAPKNLKEELDLFIRLHGFFAQAIQDEALLKKPFNGKPSPKPPTPKKPPQKKAPSIVTFRKVLHQAGLVPRGRSKKGK